MEGSVSMIKPAVKNTIFQEITNQIIDLIKNGEWLPNSRIPVEMELARNFQVGRNSIREALKALELSGIITSSSGRGTYITDNAVQKIRNNELLDFLRDSSSIKDMLEMRLLVEPQLAFLAAKRANEEDLKELEDILNALKKSVHSKHDYLSIGYRFHMKIAEMSKNKVLLQIYNSIAEYLLAQREIASFTQTNNNEDLANHQKLYDLIKTRQAAKAYQTMIDHFQTRYDINNVIQDELPGYPLEEIK